MNALRFITVLAAITCYTSLIVLFFADDENTNFITTMFITAAGVGTFSLNQMKLIEKRKGE